MMTELALARPFPVLQQVPRSYGNVRDLRVRTKSRVENASLRACSHNIW